MVTGHIKTGAVTHDMTAGGELFLRSVQEPGFYTGRIASPTVWCRMARSTPTSAPRISTSPSRPSRPGSQLLEDPLESAGPRTPVGRQPSIRRA